MAMPKCLTNPTLLRVPGGVLERLGQEPCVGGRELVHYRLYAAGHCYGNLDRTADRQWWAAPNDGRCVVLAKTRASAVAYLFEGALKKKVIETI